MGKCISIPTKKKQPQEQSIYKPDKIQQNLHEIKTQTDLENILFDSILTSNNKLISDCLFYNFDHPRMIPDYIPSPDENILIIKDIS